MIINVKVDKKRIFLCKNYGLSMFTRASAEDSNSGSSATLIITNFEVVQKGESGFDIITNKFKKKAGRYKDMKSISVCTSQATLIIATK